MFLLYKDSPLAIDLDRYPAIEFARAHKKRKDTRNSKVPKSPKRPAPVHIFCSPPHYASARLCTATTLYIELRGRSMQAPALFPLLHGSSPSFAGALLYAMPALGHAKAARARSSPLGFNTSCGRAARWGASWWGGLRCRLRQLNYCLL